ncbi:hypothetical protein E4U52_005591 [Claviceps spartinae]|nr:hypothetical protein E4U52_005591 [Claviceps spartinae]
MILQKVEKVKALRAKGEIEHRILDAASTPAASILAIASAADPADDPADDPAADSVDDSVHYTPEAIYSRYKAAREASYKKKRLVSSARTNEAYRKAHNLLMRLTDSERAWCLLSSSQMSDKSQWTEEKLML